MAGTIKFVYEPDPNPKLASSYAIDPKVVFEMDSGYTYDQVADQFVLFLKAIGYVFDDNPVQEAIEIDVDPF